MYVFATFCAVGAPRFSNVLGSNMVLQRDRPAPIWGWDAPNVAVTVTHGGASLTATAGATGLWRVVLPPTPASLEGSSITASSSTGSSTLHDVLFGEVVLCSGQSNMEFVVPAAKNATAEIAAAANYPHVRLYTGVMQKADHLSPSPLFRQPRDEALFLRMNWSVASPRVVGGCSDPATPGCDTCCGNPIESPFKTGSYVSAVCWFAVRDLADLLGGRVPVGGIDQSYGGTSIQFWMPEASIKASDAPVATQCCGQNGGPSCLYNTQIHPYTLGPLQLSAVIFYQGEQNANCGGPTQVANATYSTMLHSLVTGWRAALRQPNLPFGTVLLAPWKGRDMDSFPLLRIAQTNVSAGVPNTFIINTLDQGDPTNPEVHSPFKQAVGKRAALGIAALSEAVPTKYLGPTYASASPTAAAGTVKVALAPESLYGAAPVIDATVACPAAVPPAQCEAFALLSQDCTWHAASASAQRDGLLLTAANWTGGAAIASRAYFANWPLAQVSNTEGIPLVPWLRAVDGGEAAAAACPYFR